MKALRITLASVLASAACAAGAQTVWDFPVPYPDGNFHTRNIVQFAQDVDAATQGALKFTVHSAGSLVPHREIKSAVRDGLVPIGEVFASTLENENPIFSVDSLPFLATDYEQAWKLYEAQKPQIEAHLDRQGLMLLYSVAWPAQSLYSKQQLNGPDDLKGLKFRVNSRATERFALLAGMTPVQVEVPDIPTAFATGRADAMVNSPTGGVDVKAWDFVDHYYEVQAWLPRNIVIANKQTFNALPQAQRQAVLDAARVAERRGWESSRTEADKATERLRAEGMKIQPLPASIQEKFSEIGAAMAKEWAAESSAEGKAILDTYQAGR